MSKTFLAVLLVLSSCAGEDVIGPRPMATVPASPGQDKPTAGSPRPSATMAPAAPGNLPPPVPLSPVGVVAAPTNPAAPPLPSPGTPVFGPQGLIGVVSGRAGNTAIVNPVGGGAPGLLRPNANGTATIITPGGPPPVTIPNPAR